MEHNDVVHQRSTSKIISHNTEIKQVESVSVSVIAVDDTGILNKQLTYVFTSNDTEIDAIYSADVNVIDADRILSPTKIQNW